MSDEKEVLRTEARKHRTWIEPGAENVEETATYFFDSIKPGKEQVVAAYWPIGREMTTEPILQRLLDEGITCALPVIPREGLELGFARWDAKTELAKGAFGTMEPSLQEWVEPDIVIVPLLAFDRKGYRLGQGGGYYDATLRVLRAKKEITAVGLGYAQQVVLFGLPVEEHDEKLDWVITPQGTHYFGE